MKQENFTLTIQFNHKDKEFRTYQMDMKLPFKKKRNMYMSQLTFGEIYDKVRSIVSDVDTTCCDVNFRGYEKEGNEYIGVPDTIYVNLNVFQVRALKLASLELN